MSKIAVLSKEISELIAAGEVIERPASVVKELIENAIDAEAKHITVEIKHGGTTYMRVADDGSGIASEDVPTAFFRHATSKIHDRKDLESIYTLGFRGEALASIAAVSKVTLLTKRREDDYGTHYEIIGGTPTGEPEQGGCPDGTTILIRDLFFNVPVRQRFMKKDVTEANAVSQIVQKIALSHPEISFQMIRDNRMEFCTDGNGDLYAAIYALFGKEFAHDLIPVQYDDGFLRVSGYVGKPLYSKSNRTFQHFFINGRYIRSRVCSVALESAYQNLIMTGKFPTCVLMLEMLPVDLDVNVHPAKAEVRFTSEKNVADSLFFAVKNALLENGLIYDFQFRHNAQDWTKQPAVSTPMQQPTLPHLKEPSDPFVSKAEPEVESPPPPQTIYPTQYHYDIGETMATLMPEETRPAAIENPQAEHIESKPELELEQNAEREPQPEATALPETILPLPTTASEPSVPESLPEKQTILPEIRVIGEVFQNYILAEIPAEQKLVIFDKHAAHERVIFERLKSGAAKQYQQLLMQKTETLLPMDEFALMQEQTEQLANMGFSFDFSNPPFLRTTAVPTFLQSLNIDEIVTEIAHNFALGKINPQTAYLDDLLHTMACKAAIKAHDKNDLAELQELAQIVYADEQVRHCPHGRPVMFVIKKHELEKQFKRV
ncbi:MAG: DNA mismatch repair endonuclease MutL [Ruminococcus sp.]|nr:DNA mismatch repair endonuclease MutL [Ruminococcus sp.]